MLASTVLFLEEFCKKVDGGKFDAHIPDANTMKLSKASYAVSLYLDSLTDSLLPRYGPGSVSERNEIPKDLYKGKLEPKKFGDYAKWLKENIPNIDNALFNMYREGVKLSKEQLDTNTEVGPLKYGFVHKGPYVDVTFSKALENLKRHL
ncbi:secreted antigen 1 [Babesia divergens]|uniref:Secreted antigen 1 n=1 Tax=Babesia divergens TaxID=32595 RepID=A0AAD9GF79_BABDI|nr:secreted antigen 1 [Babesia divergens]